MLRLFTVNGLTVQTCETTNITQHLSSWLALTHTPQDVQAEITARMQADIAAGDKTGFYPYLIDGEICFNQRWVITIGTK